MFGNRDDCMSESIRLTAVAAHRCQGLPEGSEQGQACFRIKFGEDDLAMQNRRAVVWQLLGDFGRAVMGQACARR